MAAWVWTVRRTIRFLPNCLLPSAKKNPNQFLNLANATFFQNESGNAVIPLRMTGDIARPRLSLDTQMVKENLKNSIRQGGVTKALDTFQGLLKNKDQKAAAQPSPDAPANSAQPAGEKPAEANPSQLPSLGWRGCSRTSWIR